MSWLYKLRNGVGNNNVVDKCKICWALSFTYHLRLHILLKYDSVCYTKSNERTGIEQKIKILALFDGLLKQLNIRYHNTSSKFHIWELGLPENKIKIKNKNTQLYKKGTHPIICT